MERYLSMKQCLRYNLRFLVRFVFCILRSTQALAFTKLKQKKIKCSVCNIPMCVYLIGLSKLQGFKIDIGRILFAV